MTAERSETKLSIQCPDDFVKFFRDDTSGNLILFIYIVCVIRQYKCYFDFVLQAKNDNIFGRKKLLKFV